MSEANHICAPVENPVEYRDIAGYPGYRVGNDGSVWTCRTNKNIPRNSGSVLTRDWRKMRPACGPHGYRVVGLTRNKSRKTFFVHAIVLQAFSGERPPGMQACHFPNGIDDNSIANLRWDTPSGNNRDKESQGTHQIGEKNPRAKLNSAQVLEIRARYADGEVCKDIASDFGVTYTLIRLIAQRKCWKHI